jgi:hypothetical protein
MEGSATLTFDLRCENSLIKQYIKKYIDLVLYFFVFLTFFFQLFPYSLGIFYIGYILPYLLFCIYTFFQVISLEKFNAHRSILLIYFFFLCLLFWDMISLYFSPNHIEGFTHLNARCLSFCTFYITSQFLNSEKRFKAYVNIVIMCIIWNLGYCIWEIATLQHSAQSAYYDILHYVQFRNFYKIQTPYFRYAITP